MDRQPSRPTDRDSQGASAEDAITRHTTSVQGTSTATAIPGELPEVDLDGIAAKMRPLLNRLVLLYYRQFQGTKLSSAQISILTVLAERSPMRVSEIARRELIQMPTASNAVHLLELMGLVTRYRDPSDRRGVFVDITDAGRAELEEVNRERNHSFTQVLKKLDPDQQKVAASLVPVLGSLITMMEEQSAESGR
ncbi:MAG: MarR family transcriptional regulator [Bifidobacterium sp.]|nr:MarR family transcriptional regulator [Bifidobacterium sp.]